MLFPNSLEIRNFASNYANTDIAFILAVFNAIYTAVALGHFITASISTSGASTQDISTTIEYLQQSGFVVVNSGSSITVAW